MRHAAYSIVILAALFVLAGMARSEDEPKPEKPADTLARMAWVAGSWHGEMWGGTLEAYYSTPAGGKILSHSQLLKKGKAVFYEFEVFEVDGKVLRYQPYPGGKKAGGFVLTECKPGSKQATFENPKKDFPTRVVFHRASDEQLVITLSDPHGKSDKVETFKLARRK